MNRIYKPYEQWEDYQNGMYDECIPSKENELIEKAVFILSNDVLFYEILEKVTNEWGISTDVNLSNKNCNRRAWLGQAACCYHSKVPEILTRKAWAELTWQQKNAANIVANKFIRSYEEKNKRIHKELGGQMLLQWDS